MTQRAMGLIWFMVHLSSSLDGRPTRREWEPRGISQAHLAQVRGDVFLLSSQLFLLLVKLCRICLAKGVLVWRGSGRAVPQRPVAWVVWGAS